MPKSPLELYKERVGSGVIRDDSYQHAAIDALQRLYDDMASVIPAKAGILRRKSWKIPAFAGMTRRIRGVYLHGGVGRGKSMLMDLFFDTLPETVKKRRVHFHAFMIEVHNALHEARQKARDSGGVTDSALLHFADRVAGEADVLCFDEFHVVDVADAMILGRLFTALLEKNVVVVATSNWPPDRLYEGGLQRDRFQPFIDLVKARFDIVALEGPLDYRLRLLEENGVYFWPLGEPAHQWADRLFTELTGGAPVVRQELNVKGRVIEALRTSRSGVARFTFSELCERPVGAEDYLAIAMHFHTVFLEGIPKLRYDRRNEAKRLMILVDALYEKDTRLVVTADAPPEKLYFGHDHAFEFERTVSRLLEMQSREWFGRIGNGSTILH
jgi:cell division protein ZapE